MEYIYLLMIALGFVLTCRLTALIHSLRVQRSKRIQRFYTQLKTSA